MEVVEDVFEVSQLECLKLGCLRVDQGIEEHKGSHQKEYVEQYLQVNRQCFFEQKANHELVLGLGEIGD